MLSMQHNYNTYLQQKQETIELLEVQLSKTQSHCKKLQQILSKNQQNIINMKSTHVGIHKHKRPLAHIETLAIGGGAQKQRILLLSSTSYYSTKI